MRTIRRLGIALGSFVAASLVVGLVGGVFLPIVGITAGPTAYLDATPGNLVSTLVIVVLGALIYRDIIRREQPSH
jgi:hypothetical protein